MVVGGTDQHAAQNRSRQGFLTSGFAIWHSKVVTKIPSSMEK